MTPSPDPSSEPAPEHRFDPTRAGLWAACAAGALLAAEPLWAGGGTHLVSVGLGLVFAGLAGAAYGLVARRPSLARVLWPAVGLLIGVAVVLDLGAIDRLGSKDAALAWATVILAPLGGAAFGLWAIYLPRLSAERPRLLALLMPLAVALLVIADRTLFPTTYPGFHMALRAATMALTALAGAALLDHRRALVLAVVGLGLALPSGWGTIGDAVSRPLSGLIVDGARRLTDIDGDGHSHLLGGGDCAPLDGAIGPDAPEIPGNGVDDNCVGGDGEAVDFQPAEAVPVPTTPSPMSVVLITIDALRPDRMSVYGAERPTTPGLARHFPEPGQRHGATYTAGGFTSIAVPAMMRGVLPRRIHWTSVVQTNHLRLFRGDRPLPELRSGERPVYRYGLPVDDPHRPLAWWLARRGMATAAVVDDGPSKFLEARWGTAEGFGRFVEVPGEEDDDARVADAALELLDGLADGPPFFLWTHFYGPHLPDDRRPGVPTFGDDPLARYDHEVAWADLQVARVLDRIAAMAGPDRPIAVVVTSDHGEMVWGPGRMRSHGRVLHPHAIRVPLLFRIFGAAASPPLPDGLRSTVDVMPAILALTETPAPAGLDGLPFDTPRATAITEAWFWQADGRLGLDLIGALDDEALLVFDRLRNVAALYARGDDRLPPQNLMGQRDPGALIEQISAHIDRSGGPPRLGTAR